VKIHRNYSVEEVAALLTVHKNTVREWLRRGLPALTEQRPLLILGRDLSTFLTTRRRANKRPCQPGLIYCVRCRQPQKPAGGMADFEALTATTGNLIGICPQCDTLIYRRVGITRMDQAKGDLDIQLRQAQEHIGESDQASVNCDFKQE
jgi:hypothetical protein